ncbi:MAG TPA: hypothetical protein VKU89_06785 [Solirubrobacteraceae bacterium]|nr:hypothetical protein [Solirubrobacteraceae bacterium]
MKASGKSTLLGFLSLLAITAGAPASALAEGATTATLAPSFSPNSAGARTTVVFSARLSGPGGALPSPLTKLTAYLPVGLTGLRMQWPRTLGCSLRRLLAHGGRACPARSQIGSGSALLGWEEGGRILTARARLSVFVGPTDGPYVLEVLGEGQPPLPGRIGFTESLAAVSAPFSSSTEATIPAIVTRGGQHASTLEVTLAIGAPVGAAKATPARAARKRGSDRRALRSAPRQRARLRRAAGAHRRPHSGVRGEMKLYLPDACPVGGYTWEAIFGFAGGSTQTVRTQTPCG